jgi:hypothetical protein
LTAEPDPGTSLERRGESLPDTSVPHRAGSIVAEFVASIVEEAQARGVEIVTAAEEEAANVRQAARDEHARRRDHMSFLASELLQLLEDLRREADSIAAAAGFEEPSLHFPAGPVLTDGHEEPDPVAKPVDEVHGPDLAEEPRDAEGEPEAVTIVDAVVAPDDEEAKLAEEQRSRLGRMTDDELGRTYVNAVNAAQREHDSVRAALLSSLADGAVEEALRRPAFAGEPQETPRSRRRGLLRRRPRTSPRDASFGELREACQRARREPLALESPHA